MWFARMDGGTFIGDVSMFTGEPTIAAGVAVEPTSVIVFERPELREMLAELPEFGELVLQTMTARRAWLEGNDVGVLRLIASRGVGSRLRGPRPARAEPAAGALVRRRHRRRERGAAGDARHPALRDARPDPNRRRAPQPLGRPGGAHARPAGRGRRADVRPRRAGRRSRRPGSRRLRRVGGAADLRGRGVGAGRTGRHQHQDRELPRLSLRHLRDGADPQGDAPGPALRRRAVELPPRHRARGRPRRDGARRPRRRSARRRADAAGGDRSAVANARRRRGSTASPAPASTTSRPRPARAAAKART